MIQGVHGRLVEVEGMGMGVAVGTTVFRITAGMLHPSDEKSLGGSDTIPYLFRACVHQVMEPVGPSD